MDEKTLFVELAFPAPYFLELLSQHPFAPIADSEEVPTLFNGPFILDQWKRGQRLTLRPNPFFWDQNNINLDSIEISLVQDGMTTFAMFDKGLIDWVGEPFSRLTPEMSTQLRQIGNLKQQLVGRCFWVYLNTQHPLLSSVRIRQALSLVIDRSEITKHILVGEVPLYTPLPSLLTLCCSQPLKHDVNRAKQLFEQGLEELGFTRETLPPLIISYFNSEGYRQVNEYLQQLWKKVFNINITLSGKEWNVFVSELRSGQFQIGGSTESVFYSDPIGLLERFEIDAPSNISLWMHPLYQEKLDNSRKYPQSEERVQLLKEAEQLLLDHVPFIPISNKVHFYTHHPKLKGFTVDSGGCVDFSSAYFEKKPNL